MNGQTRAVFASLSASTQYADGMNLYQFVGSNRNTATDPSGMFSYVEQSAVNYLRSDLMGQTGDTGVSSLQGALGVIALANDRYAQLDQVLGMQHDATDDSGVDRALTWYDRYQTARMVMFKGAMIGAGIGVGKKAFQFFSSRLRGKSLFSMLRGGMNKVRRFFGFGSTTARSSFRYGKKISRQIDKRGWTDSLIDETVSTPHATSYATNKASGQPATAFFRKDGSYVVRDNASDEIIQVSNRHDPNWIPDASIENPYTP